MIRIILILLGHRFLLSIGGAALQLFLLQVDIVLFAHFMFVQLFCGRCVFRISSFNYLLAI